MRSTNFSFMRDESRDRQAFGAIGYRIHSDECFGFMSDDFELIILVLCHQTQGDLRIEHGISGLQRYQLIYVSSTDIKDWMVSGEKNGLIHCFMEGDIIWDVNDELKQLREALLSFDRSMSERKRFKEFAHFLEKYVRAKQHYSNERFMDAYLAIIEALLHYARIELIEHGIRVETDIWEQLRPLNSVVYKLYEQLSTSQETIEQRVELVLLACEFFVMSKLADCSSLLLDVLRSRSEPWSVGELMMNPKLAHVREELPIVLRKLVYRSLVKETSANWTEGATGQEILYWA